MATHLIDSPQNIIQSIRRMSIVDDADNTFFRMHHIETSVRATQLADFNQQLVFIEAQGQSSAINSQDVARVETANQLRKHFSPVHFEHHSVEVAFHNDTLEVCIMFQCIAELTGFGVLQHKRAILVIQVGQSESTLGQIVEELLFGITVVSHSLVVVEMVMRQVGKDATREAQPGNTVLCDTMRTHFHKGIFTIIVNHFLQQGVQFYGIGRGMRRRNDITVDDILNR